VKLERSRGTKKDSIIQSRHSDRVHDSLGPGCARSRREINHPGGNLTGVAYINDEIAPKRLELLHKLVPTAKSIGMVNPANPASATAQVNEFQGAADRLGLRLTIVNRAR
jgi:ABC-type uncharacterized transport system substrate-binding protein